MKKILLLFVLISLTVDILGQTNYYTETKTFNENGYTYQCDVKAGMITLYNKLNQKTYALPSLKTTGEVYIDPEDGFYPLLEEDQHNLRMDQKCDEIVRKYFTLAQQQDCSGRHSLCVCRSLNPETGKIEEVDFVFFYLSGFVTIPVSVFRKIELDLKNNIQYHITNRGKQLDFVFYFFEVKFD